MHFLNLVFLSFLFLASSILEASPETSQKLRVIVVGAGGQQGMEYLEDLMRRSNVEVVAAVVNHTIPQKIREMGIEIFSGGDVEEVLKKLDFDAAIVSIPHYQHDCITRKLLACGKYVIKEKPLALTASDAHLYRELINEAGMPPIFTTVQRDTLPIFVEGRNWLELIGEPISFNYEYCFSLPGVTTGWRAKKETSGGGVVIDMGYHTVDVINRFFGVPHSLEATFGYNYEEMRQEGLEDYAQVIFDYSDKYPGLKGTMTLNRHASGKKEVFIIHGTKATMRITSSECTVTGHNGEIIAQQMNVYSKKDAISSEFDFCLPYQENRVMLQEAFERNVQNVEIIEKIYNVHVDGEMP